MPCQDLGGRAHPLDLGDEVAKVDGLGQDLGLRRGLGRRQGDGGEAGNEHDAQARLAGGGDAGDLDAIGARHDDVGQQQVLGAVFERVDGVIAVVAIDDVVAGPFQRPRQEASQRCVVFGQQDARHA